MCFPIKKRYFWSNICYQLIIENSYERGIEFHMLFLDFRLAFDSVRWVKLHKAMRDMEIPLELVKLMKMVMIFTKPKIK